MKIVKASRTIMLWEPTMYEFGICDENLKNQVYAYTSHASELGSIKPSYFILYLYFFILFFLWLTAIFHYFAFESQHILFIELFFKIH